MNAPGGFGSYSAGQAVYDRPVGQFIPLLDYYTRLGIFDTADMIIEEAMPLPSNRPPQIPWQAMQTQYPEMGGLNAPQYGTMPHQQPVLQQPVLQQPLLQQPGLQQPPLQHSALQQPAPQQPLLQQQVQQQSAPQFAEQFFSTPYTAAPASQPSNADVKPGALMQAPLKDHSTWQIAVRGAPAIAEEQDFRDSFGKCGEIAEVRFCQSGNFVLICFRSKEGALRAFQMRRFSVLNVPVTIYVEEDSLKLVLKNVPDIVDELEFQRLIDEFLLALDVQAFVYAQVVQSKAGRLIYLNFLVPDDLKSVEEVLRNQDFTNFMAQKLASNEDFEGFESLIRCDRYHSKEERAAHHRSQQPTQVQFQVQQGGYSQQSAFYQGSKARGYGEVGEVKKTSIYLSDLPLGVKKSQIEQALQHYGPIKHINIYEPRSNAKRQCATCYFDSPSPVQEALRIGTCVVAGETARITPHVTRQK